MKKDDTSKKRKLPTIDHGIDIIGDEWVESEDWPQEDEDEWASNEVNADALQNEENWEDEADVRMIYNDAQMLNGSFEGDTISQIGKKYQKKEKVAEKPKEKSISDN